MGSIVLFLIIIVSIFLIKSIVGIAIFSFHKDLRICKMCGSVHIIDHKNKWSIVQKGTKQCICNLFL